MDINFNLRVFSVNRRIIIHKEWVRFTLFMGVALVSTVVSYWGSTDLFTLILLLISGFFGLLVLNKSKNLGFIFLFLSAMFVPYVGPGGLNAAVFLIIFLVGQWLLNSLIVRRGFQFVHSSINLPVMIFIGISILALGMGQISWFAFARQAPFDAQVGGFMIFVLSAAILLLTANMIKDERWLRVIVWVFIGLGTLYILGRALEISLVDRLYQTGFTAGSMFWTWLVSLAFSQALFNTILKWRYRVLLGLIVLLAFYVAFFQANDWKSGWVPPLLVIMILLGMRYKKLMVLAIPIGLIMVGAAANDLIASDEYSWGTRVDAWLIVLEISRVNPLLGLGFSNYYWYTPLYPIRGWQVNFNSHSQYVDLIAQVGILGLACFFWIFFEVGKLGWKLSVKLPDGFARSYAYGVIAGVIGSMLAAFLVDWILPFVYNIGLSGFRASILPWVFCGGLVSLEQIYFGNLNSNYLRGIHE